MNFPHTLLCIQKYLSFAQKLMKFEAHPHHYAIRLELLELNTFLIHLQFPFLVQ